jgi:TonB family protein
MKPAALELVVLNLAVVVGTGCASETAAKRDESSAPVAARAARRPASSPEDAPPAMRVDSELGVLETEDVEATLQEHFEDIRGCYGRAGKAQRYAEGKVLLRFLVRGDGSSEDVLVIESSLGNYDVERCLVEVGRRISFHAPSGHKATTFEYPVEFRSTNQVPVLEIDGVKVERDLATFLPQLAACGPLTNESASAIIYIEPNGFPGSVGLAADAVLDEDVGDCVVQTIRGWKMSAALPGRVMRATFSIPRVFATAEATHRTSPHRRHH